MSEYEEKMNAITFKIINHDTPEYRATVALREEILYKPLGLTILPQDLEEKKDHIHIAGFQEDEVIATVVLVPQGNTCKMQRVAVKTDRQGSGIGSQMIAFCESQAKAQGFQSIYCHAQKSAELFYLKNHYVAEGEYFEEATIPHLKMRKLLTWDITTATKEEAELVDKKLVESIRNEIHLTQETVLKNYVIKDEGKIIAGINAFIMPWGIMYVDVLFVDESYRYKGLGTTLLKRVEGEAKAMGAALSNLTSFDFQARDFYIKQGYEIFGALEDNPKGHTLYFLKKNL